MSMSSKDLMALKSLLNDFYSEVKDINIKRMINQVDLEASNAFLIAESREADVKEAELAKAEALAKVEFHTHKCLICGDVMASPLIFSPAVTKHMQDHAYSADEDVELIEKYPSEKLPFEWELDLIENEVSTCGNCLDSFVSDEDLSEHINQSTINEMCEEFDM